MLQWLKKIIKKTLKEQTDVSQITQEEQKNISSPAHLCNFQHLIMNRHMQEH